MSKEEKKDVTVDENVRTMEIMGNEEFRQEMITLLRTRCPLFYVETDEEKRFKMYLDALAKVKGYKIFMWDNYNGMYDLVSREKAVSASDDCKDPMEALTYIIGRGRSFNGNYEAVKSKKSEGINGEIYVLLDFFRYIGENPDIERQLKEISFHEGIVTTIVTGPQYTSTPVIESSMPMLNFPKCSKEEIKDVLYKIVEGVEGKVGEQERAEQMREVSEQIDELDDNNKNKKKDEKSKKDNKNNFVNSDLLNLRKITETYEEDLINSVTGLSLPEAELALTKSIVQKKRWDIPTILSEKRQIINKTGILEFFDTSLTIKDVGGLGNLINWIKKRRDCFSQEARDYGLPQPKGLLSVGLPGTGKSLVCKAIAGTWELPLLRLDFGRLFDSLVGQSEARARSALKLAESISPCCLWIDEIEKSLSGGKSSGSTDGGTTSRVLSTFLTWMQEKKYPVFVVATANNHESIPPEFLRAGRFDEIFFVDIPNVTEKEEIFKVLLKRKGRNPDKFNISMLASDSNSDKCSGAEIEKAIETAMLTAFHDNKRDITEDDIIQALNDSTPLYKVSEDTFIDLREWAENSAIIRANSKLRADKIPSFEGNKDLDIEF